MMDIIGGAYYSLKELKWTTSLLQLNLSIGFLVTHC